MRILVHLREGRRGQAIVEAALALPILIFLLIALIEGGRFAFYSESLNHAAREGARYAIIHGDNAYAGNPAGPAPNDPNVEDAVRAAAVGFNDPEGIVVTSEWPVNNRRGDPVIVTVTYTYSPVIPVFDSITVRAESTLVINN